LVLAGAGALARRAAAGQRRHGDRDEGESQQHAKDAVRHRSPTFSNWDVGGTL
jgi:hypothetical protein